MKYTIGAVFLLIILGIFTYFILDIWDIEIMSVANFKKILATVGLLALVSIILIPLISFFFKKNSKGYDNTKGHIAHPKQ